MKHIEEFVDERQKSWCIHCGGWIGDLHISRDHVPTKTLLRQPYPDNLPVVEVCKPCNEGFSLDEQYLVALLGSVLSGSTDPEMQFDSIVKRILEKNKRLQTRIERSKTSYRPIDGETRYMWAPEKSRVARVILKNARGHAFFEFGEPMVDAPDYIWFAPLEALTIIERERFEDVEAGSAWPEVGSRMMTRLMNGQDFVEGWVIVQNDIYRYCVTQQGETRVRTVLSEYLATEVSWSIDG